MRIDPRGPGISLPSISNYLIILPTGPGGIAADPALLGSMQSEYANGIPSNPPAHDARLRDTNNTSIGAPLHEITPAMAPAIALHNITEKFIDHLDMSGQFLSQGQRATRLENIHPENIIGHCENWLTDVTKYICSTSSKSPNLQMVYYFQAHLYYVITKAYLVLGRNSDPESASCYLRQALETAELAQRCYNMVATVDNDYGSFVKQAQNLVSRIIKKIDQQLRNQAAFLMEPLPDQYPPSLRGHPTTTHLASDMPNPTMTPSNKFSPSPPKVSTNKIRKKTKREGKNRKRNYNIFSQKRVLEQS